MLLAMFILSWAVMEFLVRRDTAKTIPPPPLPQKPAHAESDATSVAPVATDGLLALGRALDQRGQGETPRPRTIQEGAATEKSSRPV